MLKVSIKVDRDIILRIVIKAFNNIINLNKLVFTLLMFKAYSKIIKLKALFTTIF